MGRVDTKLTRTNLLGLIGNSRCRRPVYVPPVAAPLRLAPPDAGGRLQLLALLAVAAAATLWLESLKGAASPARIQAERS